MALPSQRADAAPPAGRGRDDRGLRAGGARIAAEIRARPIAAHLVLMGTVAFSGGIHAGLVPAHLDDGVLLPAAFAAAGITLGVVAIALGLRPGSVWPPRAAATVFAGQLVAYLVFTEDLLDPIGVTTKVVEVAGIVVALSIGPAPGLSSERRALAPVYVLLVAFVGLVALQASGQHGH